MKKESWFDAVTWAEFFIAFIIARTLQLTTLPEIGMVFLLPLAWVAVHFLLGGAIRKYGTRDLFGKKN